MESNYLIDNFDMKFTGNGFSFDNLDETDDDLIMNTKIDDFDDENFMNFDLNEELKNFMINSNTGNNIISNDNTETKEEIAATNVAIENNHINNNNNNENEENNEQIAEEEEGEDHLPRVQVELDRLNYTNESINNLELELEVCINFYLN